MPCCSTRQPHMSIFDSYINFGTVQARAQGTGQLPPTVSAPCIHYTTTIDARALIYPDTCIFFAHNKSFEKRILHVLRVKDELTLFKQRPLYLDDEPKSHRTCTIYELICEKFDRDDPASLHIFHSDPGFSKHLLETLELTQFHKDLKEMSIKLPFIPPRVETWGPSAVLQDYSNGLPKMFKLTRNPTDEGKKYHVEMHGHWLPNFEPKT